MAPATDLRGEFHARFDRPIAWIGGVVGGWTVAAFALDARQMRGSGLADKSRGQTETNRVADNAVAVGFAAGGRKCGIGKGTEMGRVGLGFDDGGMAL